MNSTPRLISLDYQPDSSVRFGALAERPWSIFLDSGGRGVDLWATDPASTLVTRSGITWQVDRQGPQRVSKEDPLALLAEALGPLQPSLPGLPFPGGAMGYFAYDLAQSLQSLPVPRGGDPAWAEMAVGIYRRVVMVDHQRRQSWLVDAEPERRGDPWWRASGRGGGRSLRAVGEVEASLGREAYGDRFRRIQAYIGAGDVYQVNLTRRFTVPVTGDPWQGYRALRRLGAVPYGGYFNTGEEQILSRSPECFLQLHEGRVATFPIKGTRPRGATPDEDRVLARALQQSAKDRAENLMIVDLLRNDLGRGCAVGSVEVPELFALESFANVHHLVSQVRGRLAHGVGPLDLLRDCFPGGSITGAPKRRAMQVIAELEPHRRGIYCGAMGYVGLDGGMQTNIAIRTLVHTHGLARFWAGGGIVADSVEQEEYQETLDKAAPMFRLLGCAAP